MVVFRDERSEQYPRYSKRVVERYGITGVERGLEFLDIVYGLDPDFAELLSQYVRGGMYSREVVPQSTREICACAVLAATDKQGQLRAHLADGVAHGATKEQLLEAVLQAVTYGGFPAVVSSIRTYAEVFPEMVKHDRPALPADTEDGWDGSRFGPAVETAAMFYGQAHAQDNFARYDRWDPAFSRLAQRFVFGGMYARTVVSAGMRELIAIACLTARNALPQLEGHLRIGHRLGLTREEMQEVILQVTVYAGYPYVMQAMAVFERVAGEWERESGPMA